MFNKFIFYSICCLIVWLPIPLGSNRPWAWAISEIVVFVLFLLHSLSHSKMQTAFFPAIKTWPIFCLIGALLITLSLQLAFDLSLDPIQTQILLLKTISFFLFAWLVCVYTHSKARISKIVYALIIAGLFQAIYATILNLSPNLSTPLFGLQYAERANGSFIYHNHLANYLAMILAISIGFIISELKISPNSYTKVRYYLRDIIQSMLSKKLIIRLSLIVIVVALLLTRSRMGNVAFFASLAIMGLFALRFYNKKPWSLKYLIASFFAIDIILVGTIFDAEKLQTRLIETSFVEETRDEVVRDSLTLIENLPITGSGGGSFYGLFPTSQSLPYSGFYDHAHNEYVQFAIEFGLISSLIVFVLLLYIFFIVLKNMTKKESSLYKGVSFGVATSMLFMMIHIFVDFPLQATANAMTFIVIMCLGLLCNSNERLTNRRY
ncbi:O-antigen ligase family protein [Pseudoalteromonas neustonica]|uniref:O-antigen ligase family protein n=1 Tax=Pseudoalteromonas neustonica TaxID=1840331 RepID=A0ABU9U138_9GAMM